MAIIHRGLAGTAAALTAAWLAAAAAADSLRPMQGGSFALGGWTASVYYTEQGELYEVVATLAAPEGAPVRFTAALAPGQSATVEVGSVPSGAPAALVIARDGDALTATPARRLAAAPAPAVR